MNRKGLVHTLHRSFFIYHYITRLVAAAAAALVFTIHSNGLRIVVVVLNFIYGYAV